MINEEKLVIVKGPDISKHEHPSNREKATMEVIRQRIKICAEEHLKQLPAQILRTEFARISSGVLSQLPEEDNF